LFYWIEIKNDNIKWWRKDSRRVSILVLLDRDKELSREESARPGMWEFQSLFYWIEIKNRTPSKRIMHSPSVSILVLLDRDKEQRN